MNGQTHGLTNRQQDVPTDRYMNGRIDQLTDMDGSTDRQSDTQDGFMDEPTDRHMAGQTEAHDRTDKQTDIQKGGPTHRLDGWTDRQAHGH